jgi:hypothetical protein
MTGSDVCLNGTTTGILGATCTETFSFTCVCAQVDCQLGHQQYPSSCPADNGCIQADVATDYGRSLSFTVRPDSFKPVNPGGTALTPMAVYTSRFAAAGSDSDINVFSVVAQEAADVYVTELRLADDVTDGPWLPLTTAFPTLLASSTSNFGKSNVASVLTSRGGGAHTATMFVGDVGVASNNGTVFWMNVGIGDAIGGGCCSFDTGSSGTISAPAEAGIVGFGTRVLFRWRTLAIVASATARCSGSAEVFVYTCGSTASDGIEKLTTCLASMVSDGPVGRHCDPGSMLATNMELFGESWDATHVLNGAYWVPVGASTDAFTEITPMLSVADPSVKSVQLPSGVSTILRAIDSHIVPHVLVHYEGAAFVVTGSGVVAWDVFAGAPGLPGDCGGRVTTTGFELFMECESGEYYSFSTRLTPYVGSASRVVRPTSASKPLEFLGLLRHFANDYSPVVAVNTDTKAIELWGTSFPEPTPSPTIQPTPAPSLQPTTAPTAAPSPAPPTFSPTPTPPTPAPPPTTPAPTESPSPEPTPAPVLVTTTAIDGTPAPTNLPTATFLVATTAPPAPLPGATSAMDSSTAMDSSNGESSDSSRATLDPSSIGLMVVGVALAVCCMVAAVRTGMQKRSAHPVRVSLAELGSGRGAGGSDNATLLIALEDLQAGGPYASDVEAQEEAAKVAATFDIDLGENGASLMVRTLAVLDTGKNVERASASLAAACTSGSGSKATIELLHTSLELVSVIDSMLKPLSKLVTSRLAAALEKDGGVDDSAFGSELDQLLKLVSRVNEHVHAVARAGETWKAVTGGSSSSVRVYRLVVRSLKGGTLADTLATATAATYETLDELTLLLALDAPRRAADHRSAMVNARAKWLSQYASEDPTFAGFLAGKKDEVSAKCIGELSSMNSVVSQLSSTTSLDATTVSGEDAALGLTEDADKVEATTSERLSDVVVPEIPYSSFTFDFDSNLGSGGFATVHLGELKETGRRLAVKRVHTPDDASRRQLRREAATLVSFLDCVFIVDVVGISTKKNHSYLLMELMSESLRSFSQSLVAKKDTGTLVNLLQDVAEGMSVLHSRNVLHHDLKCDNVLVDASGAYGRPVAKLTDFGLARGQATATRTRGVQGTPGFLPPEYHASGRYTVACDVYAFGSTVFEAFSGTPPWGALSIEDAVKKISAGDMPDLAKTIPDEAAWLRQLTTKCWSLDPNKRPHFSLVAMTFITKMA